MKELLKKKSVKIALLLIVLLVVIGIVGINVRSAQRGKDYNAHMDAAEKYLTELDYEQAIAEYTMAFEIDPKEEVVDALEQTYLAYAQTFVDAGDYEKAVSILEEGYEKIERESLQNRIEEVQVIQEEMRTMEAQIQEQKRIEEEAEAAETSQEEDVKQLVESGEFREITGKLYRLFSSSDQQYITDEQIRELCWPVIEALERYRALYPENLYNYIYLPYLYFLAGEYELCAQIRTELQELVPDRFSSEESTELARMVFDEYGRNIMEERYDMARITEIEYGQNGKVKRVVATGDSTEIREYEYDSEGRISKATLTLEGEYSMTNVSTYEYSGGGFTLYVDIVDSSYGFHQVYRETYVINEYGEAERVGEPIYELVQ